MSTPAAELNPNDNNAHLVYIPAAVFAVVCPLLVVMRIWARLRRGGKLGPDDWAAVAALIAVLLLSGFLVGACQYGMGRHLKLLEPEDKFETMKYFYMAQVTYKTAINLSKVCILLLYLRIFNKVRWFKWACWAILTCVTCYCIASTMATIFQCKPINRVFDKSIPGTCIDNSKFWYANAGFSIATDIIILLLPMPLVYQLHVPIAQKVALIAVFALGIFVVITSCLRITTLDILATTPDTTYDIANVMWTIIEPNVAVVCACLPILRPFIVKLIPALRSKGTSNRYYNSNAYGNKSGATPGGSQARGERADWVEIGGAKSDGIHLATVQRAGSTAGSEDSILQSSSGDGHAASGAGNSTRIQKTVEYSIQYTDKN